MKIDLEILPGRYAVTKLSGFPETPALPIGGASKPPFPMLFSLSVTDSEISLVAPEFLPIPEYETREEGFRAFRVAGTLDFGLTGILAKLTGLLAEEKIPVFVVSTFDTDYLLIREEFQERARRVFENTRFTALADDGGATDTETDGGSKPPGGERKAKR